MLTLSYHLHTISWGLPALFMLGSAPSFMLVWTGWRTLSAVFPTRYYAKGDDYLYSLYQRLVLFFFENYTGVELVMYGDADEIFKKKENAIVLCNHQSTVDWIIADMLAVRQNSIGHIRYILKDGLKYFPLYGLYFRQHSGIYVRRGGKFQQDHTIWQLDQLASSRIPFWMVVFPEGTRINKRTLKNSKEFSSKNGLPYMNYVLAPRYKATQLCIERLREKTDAVYDITAAYSDTTDLNTGERLNAPGLPDFLRGASKKLHILVERIDIRDIPTAEEDIKAWLQDRYVRKDNILQKFYQTQPAAEAVLSENGRVDKLSLKHTLPPFLFFASLNTVLLGTEEGRSLYWKIAVFGTIVGWAWMTARS